MEGIFWFYDVGWIMEWMMKKKKIDYLMLVTRVSEWLALKNGIWRHVRKGGSHVRKGVSE